MSAEMVKAILAGNKTQTRRIIKPQPNDYINRLHNEKLSQRAPYRLEDDDGNFCGVGFQDDNGNFWRVPYGQCGDRLWVKETFSINGICCDMKPSEAAKYASKSAWVYRATPNRMSGVWKWKPSIFMPRAASRIALEITGVRVERLHDISRGDCMAEGCPFPNIAMSQPNATDPKKWYSELWESINGDGSWAKNPWVWCLEFKKIANA